MLLDSTMRTASWGMSQHRMWVILSKNSVWEIHNEYPFPLFFCCYWPPYHPAKYLTSQLLLFSHQPWGSWSGNLGSREEAGLRRENFSCDGLLPTLYMGRKSFFNSPDVGGSVCSATPQRGLLRAWDTYLKQTKGQSKSRGGDKGLLLFFFYLRTSKNVC